MPQQSNPADISQPPLILALEMTEKKVACPVFIRVFSAE
jgi:hypothetical protein